MTEDCVQHYTNTRGRDPSRRAALPRGTTLYAYGELQHTLCTHLKVMDISYSYAIVLVEEEEEEKTCSP